MIKIDFGNLERFQRDMGKFATRALPHAAKAGLNSVAFDARKVALKRINRTFTTRNRFTERSVRVDKAKGLRMDSMQSVMGSTADYMATQETGGTKRKRGKQGLAIPTSFSSNEGNTATPRRKTPTASNKLARIQVRNRFDRFGKRTKNRGQRNVMAVKQAVRHKRAFFMKTRRGAGLFRVKGGKSNPRVKMVYDLSKQSVRLKSKPWMRPTVAKMSKRAPKIMQRALAEQVRRQRVFDQKRYNKR